MDIIYYIILISGCLVTGLIDVRVIVLKAARLGDSVVLHCHYDLEGCLVTGLKDVRVTVPKAARRGDSVVLHCHYDLEGDSLYAVKWYKGRAEFYRYTPKEKPTTKLFGIPGLSELIVDKNRSNETQVLLMAVTTSLSGQYNCEVSADAPSFHTAIAASFMDVVEVPIHQPVLSEMKARYRVREVMIANCTAAPSKPAVNLTWVLNGENVNPRMVRQYRQVPEKYPDLQQSMSVLEVPIRAHHFKDDGRLKVRCTASLYDLYWQTTEKTLEEEGHSAVTDNQDIREGKDEWDDYDEDYDSETNVIFAEFPKPSPSGDGQPSSITCLIPQTAMLLTTVLVFSIRH